MERTRGAKYYCICKILLNIIAKYYGISYLGDENDRKLIVVMVMHLCNILKDGELHILSE